MKNWLRNSFKAEEVEAFNKREEEKDSKNFSIRFQHYLDNLIWDFQDNLTDALDKIFPSSYEEELENINEEYEEEYEETYEEDDDEEEVPLKWHDYVVMAIGTTIYFFGFFYFATL